MMVCTVTVLHEDKVYAILISHTKTDTLYIVLLGQGSSLKEEKILLKCIVIVKYARTKGLTNDSLRVYEVR